jgi:GAF domain-containing protein
MHSSSLSQPLFADPKRVLLDLAQEQSLSKLLRLIVTRLTGSPRVALARIWLAQSTSDCSGCPLAEACRTQTQCLHLVASGGQSVVTPAADWTSTEGAFRRIAFGTRKVGRIAASGVALEEPDLTDPLPEWVARPDWIQAEGIRGFAGQPMIHRGEVLGVLALFARQPIAEECLAWLRMIADHAAAAITTARAFAEIDALRKRLELENE